MIGGIQTILCYLGFFFVYYQAGYGTCSTCPGGSAAAGAAAGRSARAGSVATTVFHVGVVTAQIGNAFACRTERGSVHRPGFQQPFPVVGHRVRIGADLALVYVRRWRAFSSTRRCRPFTGWA